MQRSRLRRYGWIALAWSLAALVGAAQAALRAWLGGGSPDPGAALVRYLPILALWALATPAILWSAQRWPVRGRRRLVHGALHVVAGSAFVLAINLLVRLPILFQAESGGLAEFRSSTLVGLATYYHLALIVYLAIVGIGHVLDHDAAAADGAGAAGDGLQRLTLRTGEGLEFVAAQDVDWIEADDNYAVVHAGGRTIRARERLSDLESRLDPGRFARIHRSAIVQIPKIRELKSLSRGDHAVVLLDGTQLRLARSRTAALQAILGPPAT